jgi:transposase-like protein
MQDSISENINYKIFQIRGIPVMLDADLAILYKTETKQINRAVQRNKMRFPNDFAFQLTSKEWDHLRFQSGTSKKSAGGRRYLPYVFSEQGVAMLSAVLRTDIALEVSISIIRKFVELKNSQNQIMGILQRVEKVELIQNRQIENLLNQFQEIELPKSGIFFNDHIFDAYVFSSEIISRAKKSIVLIDNYIDETTLLQLSKRKIKVSCIIYTEQISPQLNLDLSKHNAQFPPIEIRTLKNVHDRFLIIDNKTLYHLGASLKDLGKRWFAFSKMNGILPDVLKRLE